MRSIWKGSLAFGLVNVPVKVYSATESHDIRFHQVHNEDGGRIKYDRICTVCGKSVPFADIDKAYDSDDGERVILTDADFEKLPVAEKHEIPVLQFVPTDQIDPILFEKSYFLEPDSATPKAYALLAETLERSDRTALVYFTLRQRTRLAALRSREGVLVIQTLLWPDEVRAVSFPSLDDVAPPTEKELAMADMLVESMAEDFDPAEHTDEYQLELRNLVDEMIANGGSMPVREAEPESDEGDAEVLDLVAALRRSVAAATDDTTGAEKTTSDAATGEGTTDEKATAKKTAAKKTAAKKTAAKKTAAKKTAAKKTTATETATKTATKAAAKKTASRTSDAEDAPPARKRA